jgi:hypothetical protein
MSSLLTVTAKNSALDALGSYTWASLHYAYSSTGVNEFVPSLTYARQQIVWVSAVGSLKYISDPITFPLVTAGSLSYIGMWDDPAAGNFMGMAPCTSSMPLIFTCNDTTGGLIFCMGHLFAENDRVYLWNGQGYGLAQDLPGGFGEQTAYYAINVVTDYFSISLTASDDPITPGTPIVPSAAGIGFAQSGVIIDLDGATNLVLAGMTIDARLI